MSIDIKVIAPSSKSSDTLDLLYSAKQRLKQYNINLIFSSDIFLGAELPFFAASIKTMKQDFINAITSSRYNIIWAARGGYGAANIAEECIDIKPSSKEKILIGFSDITAMHILFNQFYYLPTVHGPVVSSFEKNNMNFTIFENIFRKKESKYNLQKINNKTYSELAGKLIGGNLKVLCTLIGTNLHPNFDGKILLLEDVNEPSYSIHRNLMHMKKAGLLENLKAIIFAEFTESDHFVEQTLQNFIDNNLPKLPAFRVRNIGHVENNLPIILGSYSSIRDLTLTVANPFQL